MDEIMTKLVDLVGSTYLSAEEGAEIERLHLQSAPLTEEEINWLRSLYSRLYSVMKPA